MKHQLQKLNDQIKTSYFWLVAWSTILQEWRCLRRYHPHSVMTKPLVTDSGSERHKYLPLFMVVVYSLIYKQHCKFTESPKLIITFKVGEVDCEACRPLEEPRACCARMTAHQVRTYSPLH